MRERPVTTCRAPVRDTLELALSAIRGLESDINLVKIGEDGRICAVEGDAAAAGHSPDALAAAGLKHLQELVHNNRTQLLQN